jgi:hypothetical protein
MGNRNWASFNRHKLSNRKHSNANRVATKFLFNHHTSMNMGCSIDNGLISTIDLATKFDLAMKFGLFSNKM